MCKLMSKTKGATMKAFLIAGMLLAAGLAQGEPRLKMPMALSR